MLPRLLISVRDLDEAQAALHGGCDILDIKEPHRGSLGMAPLDTIQQIVAYARREYPSVPITAALGEALDYPVADAGSVREKSAELSNHCKTIADAGSVRHGGGSHQELGGDFDWTLRGGQADSLRRTFGQGGQALQGQRQM